MSDSSPLFRYGSKPYAERQEVNQLIRTLLTTVEASDLNDRVMAALEGLSATQRYNLFHAVRVANVFFDGPIRPGGPDHEHDFRMGYPGKKLVRCECGETKHWDPEA